MKHVITAVFFLIAAILFFSSLGGWDLQNPDEPRYAQVAREMKETGQYALPHINAQIYPDKPPLMFWMISIASIPFGDVSAFAARFPAALFGFCLILLTYFVTKKLFDPLTALLAAIILFTTEGFFKAAFSVHFDAILAFFTTASLFCFYYGYLNKKKRGLFLLSWLCIGLAISTKGPVGLAVPLVSILVFLLYRKDMAALKSFFCFTGLSIVAVTVACWLVPACILGGNEYTHNILLKQTAGRLIRSYSHSQPFYYYIYKFPLHILPWSLFIPGTIYYFWKQKNNNPAIRFFQICFVTSFVFLSLVSGKRGLYLVPLYPVAAILLAKFWSDHMRMEQTRDTSLRHELFTLPAVLIFILFSLAVIIEKFLPFFEASLLDIAQAHHLLLKISSWLICCLGVTGCVFLFNRFRIRATFFVIASGMIVSAVCTVFAIYPALNTENSARSFAQQVSTIVNPEDTLLSSFKPALFNYYLHRYPIPYIGETDKLMEMLLSSERVYLLMRGKQYQQASKKIKGLIFIVAKDTIGHRTYYLAANKMPIEEL